ncbi:hypothetical protein BpHYR1_030209 [Brachionus plicatilis]|uniref:Uncharacterized protein n=1 Tax=Brachionus plicatilis TaxID=10195 RepID=A0A3M7RK08_BRAPC|nr:hypothetical protein BpHYR1_030209 [Brachionus plicatilis]
MKKKILVVLVEKLHHSYNSLFIYLFKNNLGQNPLAVWNEYQFSLSVTLANYEKAIEINQLKNLFDYCLNRHSHILLLDQ